MKKFILLAGLAASTVWASAQTEVVTGVMRGKDYGVTYSLPKTMVEIEIKTNKVTYTPGEFFKYADRFLRLPNVKNEAETYWELNSVSVRSVGIPDSEQVYFVKMKDKSVAPLIELTADGIIKSINVPIQERIQDKKKVQEPVVKKKAVNPRQYFTQEILMAGSTSKMAELVAQEIYNIRESKSALVRGQADAMPTDGEQLKLMLNNLQEQEQALTTTFAGITDKEERTFTLRLYPEKIGKDMIVFRFSKKLGVLGQDDLAGEPVYLSLENLNTLPAATDEDKKGKSKEEGVAYNVPGKAKVTLTQNGKVWTEKEILLTQFGEREFLAPTLFNKNSTIKVIFDPTTGGLVKIDRVTE